MMFMEKGRENFDFHWKFQNSDDNRALEAAYDDSAWENVRTPHDWSVRGPFARSNPAGGDGAYLPAGIGWYRKHFFISQELSKKRIYLDFDGVYMNCEIWLNGQSVGKHCYGYTSFRLELTSQLNYGGDNLIAVRVDNSEQPNSRWYSGSGIFRHVWMTVKEPVHIAYNGVAVTTSGVSAESAVVKIVTEVESKSDRASEGSVVTEIYDPEGKLCQRAESIILFQSRAKCCQELQLKNPALWSNEMPNLYKVAVLVTLGDETADSLEFSCGIRTARFDIDHGFLLNGRQVKLKGVCLHHDGGCVGAAVPEKVWERRLRLLKQMGCNAIRTSHNPPAPEFLDMLDEMGFLVMEEAFDEWTVCKVKNIAQQDESQSYGYSRYFAEEAERDLMDMLRRDRNHPCIVLWSIGNEIPEQSQAEGYKLAAKMVDICRREDPTRMVTSACDKIAAEPESSTDEFTGALDVVGYNYVDRWRGRAETFYAEDRRRYPERRMIGSENRAIISVRGEYPFHPKPHGLREPYFANMIATERLWKFTAVHDYISGDFIWTGIDYLGEARWPDKSASFGPMDTCGFKKDAYYFYQSIWTEKPMVHLFPHWNWSGKEGEIIPVLCYTNCETAELFVNGKSFGEKCCKFPAQGMTKEYGHFDRPVLHPTTADLHLSWDVPYVPGVLKVVGRNNGEAVCAQEVETTQEPNAVVLETGRHILKADASDVLHLTIKIEDPQGRVVPTADNEVSLRIEGPAELIGIDNGCPESHEPFLSYHRKAFNGLCLAILRSTFEPGEIRVTASSSKLRSDIIKIPSENHQTERG